MRKDGILNNREERIMYKFLATTSLILATQISFAATWQLNNSNSHVDFTSTKNGTISEDSKFTQFSGTISDNGQATVQVSLNSVDTRIALRDERMRELLFETARFPQATFTTKIDTKTMQELSDNQPHTIEVDGTLDLHGVQHPIQTKVVAQQVNANTLQIKNAEPLVLNTNDYNMAAGVAALQKLAGLNNISSSVPVNFTLTFDKK